MDHEMFKYLDGLEVSKRSLERIVEAITMNMNETSQPYSDSFTAFCEHKSLLKSLKTSKKQ